MKKVFTITSICVSILLTIQITKFSVDITNSSNTLIEKLNEIQLMEYDNTVPTYNSIFNAINQYNEAVKLYNIEIKKFPNNIYARIFGFKPKEYLNVKEVVKK